MNLTLKRNHFQANGIFGQLLNEKGEHVAFTLEHAYGSDAEPGIWQPKVPAGAYACMRGEHQLHSGPIETFEVTGVTGHQGILIHPGNTEDSSEGCILVGIGRIFTAEGQGQPSGLTQSRDAFKQFMDIQAGADEFQLVVR